MSPKKKVISLMDAIDEIERKVEEAKRFAAQALIREYFQEDYKWALGGRVDAILLGLNNLDPFGLHKSYLSNGSNEGTCAQLVTDVYELIKHRRCGTLSPELEQKYRNSVFAKGYYTEELATIYNELINSAVLSREKDNTRKELFECTT